MLALVATILHELQTMWGGSFVFCCGVTRDAWLAGVATSGALKMDNDTTFSGFFCHGVLQNKEVRGGSPRGAAVIWRIERPVNATLRTESKLLYVVDCADCVDKAFVSCIALGVRPSSYG